MKLIFLFVGIYIFISNAAFAQNSENTYSISGRVIEAQNGRPLPNVNVSIAYSQMGTSTDSVGRFNINNVPEGNYKLVISSVGYVTVVHNLRITNSSIRRMLFKLKPKAYVLPTVNVLDKDADEWRENLNTFKEEFIGKTENSKETNIEDPYILEFTVNEAGELTALAKEPLVIYNNALGYKITYFLNKFITNEITTQYSGLPVFEKLKPSGDIEKQKWQANRKNAYLGSLRHFLKSVCDNYHKPWIRLSDIGFKVSSQMELESKIPPVTVITAKHLKPTEIETEMFLTFPNYWKITYNHSDPDSEYSSLSRHSWIKLHADSVSIDILGRYYEQFKLQTFGSWALDRISDMLPFEYNIDENEFIKTEE